MLLLALSASPALASTGESGGTIVGFPAASTSTMNVSGLVVDQIDLVTPLGINGHFTMASTAVTLTRAAAKKKKL